VIIGGKEPFPQRNVGDAIHPAGFKIRRKEGKNQGDFFFILFTQRNVGKEKAVLSHIYNQIYVCIHTCLCM